LGGLPLVAHSVRLGLEIPGASTVLCSTESAEIKAVAEQHGASVPFLRPTELAGEARGPFPSRIPKTDEERIQNMPQVLSFTDKTFTVTEKLDGTSATFYWDTGYFGVCSRNWDLLETESNSLWRWAKEQRLPEKLATLSRNIALQGEFIGPGVQGNLYKLAKTEVRLFNAYDIDTQSHLTSEQLASLATALDLQLVPVLETGKSLTDFASLDAVLAYADANSALNPKAAREGVVFRSEGETRKLSFKAISNRFLLAEA
jgi:RNA ligase (TIGR02306 family)